MAEKGNVENIYNLTPMQAGMLFYHLMDNTSTAYFEQAMTSFTGPLDTTLIEKAFNKLIEKYDILRTVFLYKKVKKPKQVILKQRTAKVEFIDISHSPENDKQSMVEMMLQKDRERNFDLEKDILMRIIIIKTHADTYKIIWSHHHIIMDGWCTAIIMQDFFRYLKILAQGKSIGTETAPSFGRYLQWIDRQDHETGFKYWQEYLEGYEKIAGVPRNNETLKPGEENYSYRLEEYEFYLDETPSYQLESIARQNNVTINNLFQVLWGILLQRYNNTDDVVFGAVVSGRPPEVEDIEHMVGLFINTIPIRITAAAGQSFSQLAEIRHRNAMQASPYEYLPLADIQAKTPLKNTLLNHIMVFENFPGQDKGSPPDKPGNSGTGVENFKSPEQSNYDFNVIVEPFRPIMVKFSYNAICYELSWMKRIARHLTHVIDQVTRCPQLPVADIEITPPEEKRHILYELNGTETLDLIYTGIHQWYSQQSAKHPQKTAIASPTEIADIFQPTACFQKNPFTFETDLGERNGTTFKLVKTHLHNSVTVNANAMKLVELFDGETNLKSMYSRLKNLENQNITFIIYAPEVIDLLEITHDFRKKPEIISNMKYDDFLYLVKLFYRANLILLSAIKAPESPVEKAIIPGEFQRSEGTPGETTLEELLKSNDYSRLTPVDIVILGDTPGMPSTGLLYLAAFLRRNGINARCRFHDSTDDNSAMKSEIENLMEKIQPKIIAISLKWFLYIARVKDMCRFIKEYALKNGRSVKVVIGGDTASYYWEELIRDENVDYIIRGDGEIPLLKLCREENPAVIPNFVYKQENNRKILSNPITYINDKANSQDIYLSNLDDIFLSETASLFGTFFIYTHRGCAMNCVYCGGCRQVQQESFNRKGGKIFARPVQQVRRDILAALPYASTFQFDFDTAGGDLVTYCREIWENIDLSRHFCIISRHRKLSKALLELAVKTFKYVYWDIDVLSLSQRHRKQLESLGIVKPQFTDEEIMNFLRQCDEHENTEVRFNLIAGLPYMEAEDIDQGDRYLAALTAGYHSLSELHWARLHAQPGAPLLTEAHTYGMHSFATTYQDFLEYSIKNFAPGSRHQQLEFLNYPYIYFNDDALNSKISLNFTETNRKMLRFRENKRIQRGTLETLTYKQAEDISDELAHVLLEKGTRPDGIVGIMLAPSAAIPLAIIGVLKAGAGYLPIDPEFPTERIAYMLTDSGSPVLITTSELLANKEIFKNWHGEIIFIEHFSPHPTTARNETKAIKATHAAFPGRDCRDRLCYLVYTSGTTGKPKGVMLTHRNLINYIQWYTRFARLSAEDNSLLTSSFAFDLGYTSLFPPLLNGGTLHIIPKEKYLWAEGIMTYIRRNQITYLKMTPSLFSVIVQAPEFSPATCRQLRLVLIGGEPIRPGDIETAHRLCPHIEFINHYGPTEAAVGCVARYIDTRRLETYKENPTIGKPITNTMVYIMDRYLRLLPLGIAGELCISGASIARGYANHPELSAEKFDHVLWDNRANRDNQPSREHHAKTFLRRSPGCTNPRSKKIYRTGDMAQIQPDGNIRFLGRIDKQVKIRGYRIETEEIELQLQKHPLIEKAVVAVRERDNTGKEKYLAAYYIPKPEPAATLRENPTIAPSYRWEEKKETEIRTLLTAWQHNVDRRPEQTALQSNGRSLTYRQLEQTAQHYAQLINEHYKDGYALSPEEKVRYKRQMLLDGWGTASQENLKSTVVFVAGAGGGASPTLTQLALAGVGTIIICDFDRVELSNLNRQFLHDETRIGMNKALSAQMTLQKLNPYVKVIPRTEKLTRENVFELVGNASVIFDMFDGLESKFILSECATVKKIPHIISAMTEISSYTAIFHSPHTPCYHCIFDRNKFDELNQIKNHIKDYEKNPLHVVASSLFTSTGFAVTEAFKILLGLDNPAYNKFIFFNQKASVAIAQTAGYKGMTYPFSRHFRELSLRQGFDWDTGFSGKFLEELTITKNPECPLCGEKGLEKRQKLHEIAKKTGVSYTPTTPVNLRETQTVGLLIDQDGYDHTPGILVGAIKTHKNLIPLDPAFPMEQLETVARNSGIRLILTTPSLYQKATQLKETVNKNIAVLNCVTPTGQHDTTHEKNNTPTLHHTLSRIHEALQKGEIITMEKNRLPVPENSDYSLTRLRDYLSGNLPDYMIPSYFIKMDKIPMTPNGKVDRQALPEPGTSLEIEKYKPPRNEVEEKMALLWADILGATKEKISIDSNFFELGGTSLTLIELVSRIHKEFGIAIPLNQIFSSPTILEISGIINSKQYVEEHVVLLNQKTGKNLFAFPGGTGFAITFSNLAYLFREYTFYSFNFIEDNENLIAEYADIITKVQPTGPYTLFGYCAGGLLANQVAKALEDKGHEVAELIVADATWDRDGSETYGEMEREFVRQIEAEVERMGLDFLKDKIKQKTEKYQKYVIALKDLEVIKTQVHFIISETLRTAGVDVKSQWHPYSEKPVIVHDGWGPHQLMFMAGTGAMEKNARIILDILNKMT